MESRAAMNRGKRGFTLIELILALVVIGVILMMSLYAVSEMAKMSKSQQNLRNATDALRTQAAIVKSTHYLELKVGRTTPFDREVVYLQHLPEGEGAVVVGEYFDVDGVKPVRIEVKWKDPKGYKSLHTVVLRAPASKAQAEDEAEAMQEEIEEEFLR